MEENEIQQTLTPAEKQFLEKAECKCIMLMGVHNRVKFQATLKVNSKIYIATGPSERQAKRKTQLAALRAYRDRPADRKQKTNRTRLQRCDDESNLMENSISGICDTIEISHFEDVPNSLTLKEDTPNITQNVDKQSNVSQQSSPALKRQAEDCSKLAKEDASQRFFEKAKDCRGDGQFSLELNETKISEVNDNDGIKTNPHYPMEELTKNVEIDQKSTENPLLEDATTVIKIEEDETDTIPVIDNKNPSAATEIGLEAEESVEDIVNECISQFMEDRNTDQITEVIEINGQDDDCTSGVIEIDQETGKHKQVMSESITDSAANKEAVGGAASSYDVIEIVDDVGETAIESVDNNNQDTAAIPPTDSCRRSTKLMVINDNNQHNSKMVSKVHLKPTGMKKSIVKKQKHKVKRLVKNPISLSSLTLEGTQPNSTNAYLSDIQSMPEVLNTNPSAINNPPEKSHFHSSLRSNASSSENEGNIVERLNKICPGIRYNLEAESDASFFMMSATLNDRKYFGNGKTKDLACMNVAKKVLDALNNIIPKISMINQEKEEEVIPHQKRIVRLQNPFPQKSTHNPRRIVKPQNSFTSREQAGRSQTYESRRIVGQRNQMFNRRRVTGVQKNAQRRIAKPGHQLFANRDLNRSPFVRPINNNNCNEDRNNTKQMPRFSCPIAPQVQMSKSPEIRPRCNTFRDELNMSTISLPQIEQTSQISCPITSQNQVPKPPKISTSCTMFNALDMPSLSLSQDKQPHFRHLNAPQVQTTKTPNIHSRCNMYNDEPNMPPFSLPREKPFRCPIAPQVQFFSSEVSNPSTNPTRCNDYTQDLNTSKLCLPQNDADIVENMVLHQFKQVTGNNPKLSVYKVLAGIVMTRCLDFKNAQVIALATGAKCPNTSRIGGNGSVLSDCHAEVIVRRCLQKYLYTQLRRHCHPEWAENSVFLRNPSGLQYSFSLDPDINFHLYIKTAPCGDARVISDSHNREQYVGQLRVKVEGDRGGGMLFTKVIGNRFFPQTWNGINNGSQPLLTMSCSDKIIRWNVLGIQGSLLSTLVEPIYLYSIVLGSVFETKHLYRALCGRLEQKLNYLPKPYHLNRPLLGKTSYKTVSNAHIVSTPDIGINWTFGDSNIEVVYLPTGVLINNEISFLSKQVLFSKYIYLLRNLPNIHIFPRSNNYAKAKEYARDYEIAKQELFDALQLAGLGCWVKKPMEQNDFTMNF